MGILDDLPAGTVWPHLMTAIEREALRDITEYAHARMSDIKRGAETLELAAVLVEKYGEGLVKALRIVGIETEAIHKTLGELLLGIDPAFDENKKKRWASRPASLVFTSS